MTTERSALPDGRDGLAQLLSAEWTKLRSVPQWIGALAAFVALAVVLSVWEAGGSSELYEPPTDVAGVAGPANQPVMDAFHFAHRPLSGDGSVIARVSSQQRSHEWALAGLMLRQRAEPMSPYAALAVTPDHGVHLQSNFTTDIAGSASGAPRWLKLTRSGTTVTGHESPDGTSWTRIGAVELPALPPTVEVGMFVTSPYGPRTIERQFGSGEAIGQISTIGTATFDQVRVEPARPQAPAEWTGVPVGSPPDPGSTAERAGAFTLVGSGGIGFYDEGFDVVALSLRGVSVALVVFIVLGVLCVTSEFRYGMIRTTFAAVPRRGRVLTAKALVVGATAFAAGLLASALAFRYAQPHLSANGYAPPGAPPLSLTAGPVLRALVGTAAVVALIAVLSLSLGAVLRRTDAAIAAVVALLTLASIIGSYLPVGIDLWISRAAPSAGFAIQRTIERYDDTIAPLAGFAVLLAYTAVAFLLALWRLRTRDA